MVNYYYMINYNIAIIVITYIRYNTRAPGGARARTREGDHFWGYLVGYFGGVFFGYLRHFFLKAIKVFKTIHHFYVFYVRVFLDNLGSIEDPIFVISLYQ